MTEPSPRTIESLATAARLAFLVGLKGGMHDEPVATPDGALWQVYVAGYQTGQQIARHGIESVV